MYIIWHWRIVHYAELLITFEKIDVHWEFLGGSCFDPGKIFFSDSCNYVLCRLGNLMTIWLAHFCFFDGVILTEQKQSSLVTTSTIHTRKLDMEPVLFNCLILRGVYPTTCCFQRFDFVTYIDVPFFFRSTDHQRSWYEHKPWSLHPANFNIDTPTKTHA